MLSENPVLSGSGPVEVSPLQAQIEQFLYREAELLDERRYTEWYELLADDIHYWMPVRTNRYVREKDQEFSAPDEVATYDEDKDSLGRRVKRLGTGLAWAEEPPSRTRRLITNVQVRPAEEEGELEVVSYFLLYRNRLETETELFAGRRDDLLRRVGDGWQIARRRIALDQAVILAKNISLFF